MPGPGATGCPLWHGGSVVAYQRFARFYDEVMDDPGQRAGRVDGAVTTFCPDAETLLELGCGTGSILSRLTSVERLTGLDASPAMLDIAKAKVPGASFVEADMRGFDLGRRFDVVACVFDSLNHLLSGAAWEELFANVHRHLTEGGLFVMDVNTVGELRRLGDDPPWVGDFDGGTAVIDVACARGDDGSALSEWDVRVFERVTGDRYELHRERIGEFALPLDRVRRLLSPCFELLEEVDDDGLRPTDDSVKAYYTARRRD